MSNKLQIKRTTVSGRLPNTTNAGNTTYIDAGELAINVTDGKLFSSNGSSLIEFGTGTPVYDETGTLISNSFVTTRTADLGALSVDIIPATDNTYSLGNSTRQWRHLYVSSNTIYLGNTSLSVSGGTLYVNNASVGSGGGAGLPSQTGNSGKFLTTDGTTASWATVAGGAGGATLTGIETLTNKTLSSPVVTGTLTAGGSTGTNGQILQSTGTGVQWATPTATFNSTTLSSNLTLSTGQSAVSVGPITIANGVTVTIADGQKWVVL